MCIPEDTAAPALARSPRLGLPSGAADFPGPPFGQRRDNLQKGPVGNEMHIARQAVEPRDSRDPLRAQQASRTAISCGRPDPLPLSISVNAAPNAQAPSRQPRTAVHRGSRSSPERPYRSVERR